MIKWNSGLLIFLLLCCVGTFAQGPKSSCPDGPHTLYSRDAATLDSAPGHPVRVTSPDGNKTLVVKAVSDKEDPGGSHIDYRVISGRETLTANLPGFNGEVAWAPDSKAFAVTQTEGGGGLGSRVYVFYVEEGSLRKIDVSRPIEKDFGSPVKCDVEVPPNTGFVSWQTDSSTLLVAAEVAPVSVCSCSGTYRVYEMNLPSAAIARTYSQTEAKKQFWNLLGCELRGADDSCVQRLEARSHIKP
jgi:hypothetical protein